MKICQFQDQKSNGKMLNTSKLFILLGIMVFITNIDISSMACIHDRLAPIKGVSPQLYTSNVNPGKKSSAETNPSTTGTTTSRKPTFYKKHRIKTYFKHKITVSTIRTRRYVHSTDNIQNKTNKNLDTQDTLIPVEEEYRDNIANSTNSDLERLQYYENADYNNDIKTNETYNTILFSSGESPNVKNSKPNVTKLFANIRVTLWFDFDGIEFSNTSTEYDRLKNGLDRAVNKITSLFKVIPVKDALLLRRQNACHRYWTSINPNGGKCGLEKPDYDGEKCLDDFKFPDDHLEGFSLYNVYNPEPVKILHKKGNGLTNTDLVVYIRAKDTLNCRKNKGVIAYAASCQVDQFERPVAGFANFCPLHLSKKNTFNSEKFYLTALHEFFHILGFSKSHFDKFQDCKMDLVPEYEKDYDLDSKDDMEYGYNPDRKYKWEWLCDVRDQSVFYLSNMFRMMTPAVMRETEKHFNCSDIGAPLENTHMILEKSSHWESRFFQGSLMTPNIGVPHITTLDKVTLAAFEDMGWYKVNYSHAEPLPWGKNMGCDFGTPFYCHYKKSPYFCTVHDPRNGCHYLHLDKGECITDEYLDSCNMYKADESSMCWNPNNSKNDNSSTGEIHSRESRCFMASLNVKKSNSKSVEGRCYQHRCNDSATLEVKVGDSNWQICAEGKQLTIPGYGGYLYCPSPTLLCSINLDDFMTPEPSLPDKSQAFPFCATIRITFPSLAHLYTKGDIKLKSFLSKFVNQVVAVTDIDSGRIYNLTFISSTEIEFLLMKNLDWSTLPPMDFIPTHKSKDEENNYNGHIDNYHAAITRIPCDEAVKRLLSSVHKKIFEVSVDGEIFMAESVNITSRYEAIKKVIVSMKVDNIEKNKIHAVPHGTTAAVIVGSLCGGIILAVGLALYYKSHVPRAVTPAPPTPTSTDVRYLAQPAPTPPSSTEIESISRIAFTV